MNKMNKAQEEYFTFAFNIDPELNDGYDEAFKQGDEPWWWYVKDGDELNGGSGPVVGPTPDFTGATFKSLHQWDKQLLP
jgi:hypothetical protein